MRQIVWGAAGLAAMLGLVSAIALAEGDAAKGEKVFVKCKVCHALEPGVTKLGPSLAGLDRKSTRLNSSHRL